MFLLKFFPIDGAIGHDGFDCVFLFRFEFAVFKKSGNNESNGPQNSFVGVDSLTLVEFGDC